MRLAKRPLRGHLRMRPTGKWSPALAESGRDGPDPPLSMRGASTRRVERGRDGLERVAVVISSPRLPPVDLLVMLTSYRRWESRYGRKRGGGRAVGEAGERSKVQYSLASPTSEGGSGGRG